MKISLLLSALFAMLTTSGCVVRGHASYGTTAYVEAPPLIEVSSGVYVIEDYDEPVFYSGGVYWLYRGDVWYRSRTYNGGWVFVDSYRVPGHVRRIDRPSAYARYRSNGRPRYYNNGGRVSRDRPAVRDHRSKPAARERPAVRDKREKRDDRDDRGPKKRDHRR